MKNNSEISVRISNVIDFLAVNANSFALKLGYDRAQTVYDIVNGKSAPSYDFFKRFMNSEYSYKISIKWLLTGKGSMQISAVSPGNMVEESMPQHKGQPCEKCILKQEIIDSLRQQVETQSKLISYLEENRPAIDDGQKRKESPEDYGHSEISAAS